MKISSNAKLLLLTNPKNAKFESHAVNTILPLPLLISPISSTLKLTKQSPTDLVFSNKTTLMLKLCFSFKPVTLKDKIVFVGKAQKFQIWDEARYAPIEAEALARVKAKMERARSGEAS